MHCHGWVEQCHRQGDSSSSCDEQQVRAGVEEEGAACARSIATVVVSEKFAEEVLHGVSDHLPQHGVAGARSIALVLVPEKVAEDGAEDFQVESQGWSVFDIRVSAGKSWGTTEDPEARLCRRPAAPFRRLPTLLADLANPRGPWTAVETIVTFLASIALSNVACGVRRGAPTAVWRRTFFVATAMVSKMYPAREQFICRCAATVRPSLAWSARKFLQSVIPLTDAPSEASRRGSPMRSLCHAFA